MTDPNTAPTFRDLQHADRADGLLLGLTGDDPATCATRLQRALDVLAQWNQVVDDAYAVAPWHSEPDIPAPFGTHLLVEHAGNVEATLADPRLHEALHEHLGGTGRFEWLQDEDGTRQEWVPSGITPADVDTELQRIVAVIDERKHPAPAPAAAPSADLAPDPVPNVLTLLASGDRADSLQLGVRGDSPEACSLRLERAQDLMTEWDRVSDTWRRAGHELPEPFGVRLLIENTGSLTATFQDPRLRDLLHLDQARAARPDPGPADPVQARHGRLPGGVTQADTTAELQRLARRVFDVSEAQPTAQQPHPAALPDTPSEQHRTTGQTLREAQRREARRQGWTPTPPSGHVPR